MEDAEACPEVSAYRLSFIALGAAFAFGYAVLHLASQTKWEPYAAMFGVFGFLVALPTLWVALNDFGSLSADRPGACGEGRVEVAQDVRLLQPPPVKRRRRLPLPDKCLRPTLSRDVALGCALALLTMALVGVSTSSPRVFLERYASSHAAGRRSPRPAERPRSRRARGSSPRSSPPTSGRCISKRRGPSISRAWPSSSWWGNLGRSVRDFLVSAAAVLVLCWLGPFALF